MQNYGIHLWGDDNFIISKDVIRVNHKSQPTLLEIIQNVREGNNLTGPVLLRFPHLVRKQIDTIYTHFNRAIEENNYQGTFNAVFPLKVNQYPEFVKQLVSEELPYNYGLEAGSKAELLLAMALTPKGAPLTVNGFKDQEMVNLGFLAAQMGHDITITIEGLNELEMIINAAKEDSTAIPNIGIRMRLHSSGSGIWAKSGGITAKFGLTSTELVEAISRMQSENLLHAFTMIHFHIGSQLEDISPLKKALREVGNIYAELIKMGADNLHAINLGGGMAIEYSQHENERDKNYEIKEFTNDVVFQIKTICDAKQVRTPDIFTESGRFIAAHHAMLIAPVLELFSHDYKTQNLRLKEDNPPLISELNYLFNALTSKNAIEYIHDAMDHLESLLTLFDLGYIDLTDRSNAEVLTHLIIKKALLVMKDMPLTEYKDLKVKLQERYLINSSFFQSIPDFWGLNQHFPVMPIHKLDQKPDRAATLWDISCDSDGEIPFDTKRPLYLHDVDLETEDYFIGFFLLGAYQEVLGMDHNLFTRPTEATINITESGYEVTMVKPSKNIMDILIALGYDKQILIDSLNDHINTSTLLSTVQKDVTIAQLIGHLEKNGYLQISN